MRDFVVKLNPILFFNDFGEITSGRRWLDRWAVGMVPSLHASGLEPTPLPCWHLGWGLRPRPCLGGLPPSPGRGLPPSPGSLATSHCSTSHNLDSPQAMYGGGGTNHSNTNVPEMKPPFRKPPVVAPSTPFLRDLLPTAKLPTNDPGHSALRACQCYNPSTTRKVQSSPR